MITDLTLFRWNIGDLLKSGGGGRKLLMIHNIKYVEVISKKLKKVMVKRN